VCVGLQLAPPGGASPCPAGLEVHAAAAPPAAGTHGAVWLATVTPLAAGGSRCCSCMMGRQQRQQSHLQYRLEHYANSAASWGGSARPTAISHGSSTCDPTAAVNDGAAG